MVLNNLLFVGFLKPQCLSGSARHSPDSKKAPYLLPAQLVLRLLVSCDPLYRLSVAWITGARLSLRLALSPPVDKSPAMFPSVSLVPYPQGDSSSSGQ